MFLTEIVLCKGITSLAGNILVNKLARMGYLRSILLSEPQGGYMGLAILFFMLLKYLLIK